MMPPIESIFHVLLALLLAPLLFGVINRTKALFAGRHGQPLLQTYYDLAKLLRKGATYSRTATWVFRAGPVVSLACVLMALCVTPLGSVRALFAFPGDVFLLAYTLGLMRFMTVTAALDTGSAFEGMGASREVQFSLLAEPALILGVTVLAAHAHTLSLSQMYAVPLGEGSVHLPAFLLAATAMFVVLLTENARIPVDDPNTHLELTMIHEVMILDHGGVDLAFIHYAAGLKLWILGSLFVGIALPFRTGHPLIDLALGIVELLIMAVMVGITESVMARLRLVRVPQLLVTASVLALLAVVWVLR